MLKFELILTDQPGQGGEMGEVEKNREAENVNRTLQETVRSSGQIRLFNCERKSL